MARFVRTPAGAKFYGLPIGSPITGGAAKKAVSAAAAAAKKTTPGKHSFLVFSSVKDNKNFSYFSIN